MDLKKKILLIISLIALSVLIYSPHFLYQLPYHLDEWDHIGRSIRLQQEGFSYFAHYTPIEIGFDIILLIISSILSIFKTDIVYVYQFLPAINALVIALILFFCLKKQFNNYWLALSAIPFLTFLPSNVNILGIWFYVPILAAVPFIYLSLFNLEKAVKNNNPKKIYLFALFLFIIAFIHQSSFLLLFIVSLIYLSSNYKFVIENKKLFYPFLIFLIPSIIMILHLSNNFSNISNFFSSFVWGPLYPQINYNLFTFYGILASLFLIIGFYSAFKNKHLPTFRIYSIISLISILIFPLTNFSILSAYQRYIYHFMIASIPLSALGLYISIKWIYNKLNNLNNKLRISIIVVIILLLLLGMSYNYFTLEPKTKLYHVIEPEEIPALQSLSIYPAGIVLTPIDMGIAVRPITKIHDEALNFFDYKKTEELDKFYNADCDTKEEYLYNRYLTEIIPNYIYSENNINCPQLKKETENIYEFNKDNNIILKINNNAIKKEIRPYPELTIKDFTVLINIIPSEEGLIRSGIIKSVYGDGLKSGWSVITDDKRIAFRTGNLKDNSAIYTSQILKANSSIEIIVTFKENNASVYINRNKIKEKIMYIEYDKSVGENLMFNGYWNLKPVGEITKILILNKSLSSHDINKLKDI